MQMDNLVSPATLTGRGCSPLRTMSKKGDSADLSDMAISMETSSNSGGRDEEEDCISAPLTTRMPSVSTPNSAAVALVQAHCLPVQLDAAQPNNNTIAAAVPAALPGTAPVPWYLQNVQTPVSLPRVFPHAPVQLEGVGNAPTPGVPEA